MNENVVQLSVIMPCYQQVAFVAEAVRSVLEQQGVEVELIVMDPGSTDGTRALLGKLKEEFGQRLILCFEPDKGQSDAINKGMARARGQILCWLNSDDRFRPGTLARVVSSLQMDQPAWLYGRCGMIDAAGQPISGWIASYKDWRGQRFSLLKLLTENFIPQMGVFWNRCLWELSGTLDLEQHLDMDYDLWLRFAKEAQPTVLAETLADFRVHAAAKGSVQTSKQLDAALKTAKRHAAHLGYQGKMAILLHRILSFRTRTVYRFLKPL